MPKIVINYDSIQFEIESDSLDELESDEFKELTKHLLEQAKRIRAGLPFPYFGLSLKEDIESLVRMVHGRFFEVVADANRTQRIALIVYAYDPLPVPLETIALCCRKDTGTISSYLANEAYRSFFRRDEFNLISLTQDGLTWISEEIIPQFPTNTQN